MKDGTFLTAKEKTSIAKDFARFVESNFDPRYFTRALYSHLSLNFGFIAHYNLSGFVAVRFADPEGRRRTFESIIDAPRWSFYDYSTSGNADLNTEIRNIAVQFRDGVNLNAKEEEKALIRAEIKALQNKLRTLEGA